MSQRFALACVAVAVIAAAVGIAVPAGLGWDFANFYDTGRRAAAGQIADIYDPRSLISGAPPQALMAFLGAPVSAWFYAPLAALPAGASLVVFKAAGTLCYAAALLLLFRNLGAAADLHGNARSRFAGTFALLIILYQPFWTMYRVGGQTTPAVFLLLVAGLLFHERDRPVATSACLLLVVLIKPALLFVPAFLALVSGRRFLTALAGLFLCGAAVSLVAAGVPVHLEFLSKVGGVVAAPAPWFYNSSLFILADVVRPIADSAPVHEDGGGMAALLLRTTIKLVVLGTIVFLLLLVRGARMDGASRRRCLFLLAITFSLFTSPVVWEHYLAIQFIPLSWLVAVSVRMPVGARSLLAAIFALSILQNIMLVDLFRLHVTITSHLGLSIVSLVKAGPLLLYLLWLWRYHRPFIESFRSPTLAAP